MTKEQFINRVKDLPGIKATPSEVSCFGLALYFVGDSICSDESKIAVAGDSIIYSECDTLGNHLIRCDRSGTFDQQLTEESAEELIKMVQSASNLYQKVVTGDKTDVQILITYDPRYIDLYLENIKDHMVDLNTDGPIGFDTDIIKLVGINITDELIEMIDDMSYGNHEIIKVVEKDSKLYFDEDDLYGTGPEAVEEETAKTILEKRDILKAQNGKEIKIFCFVDD